MSRHRETCRWALTLATVMICFGTALADPLGTGFSYQGRLKMNGNLVVGATDLRFRLWNHATSTDPNDQIGATIEFSQVADPNNPDPVVVERGLFQVELDFGVGSFDGDERWLEIQIRHPSDPTDTAPYAPLTARQKVTATPYAIYSVGQSTLSAPDGDPAPAVTVDDEGAVGIGALPVSQARLTVGGGSGGRNIRLESGGLETWSLALTTSGNRGLGFRNEDDGAYRLLLSEDGHVGIGTTSPGVELDVAGSARIYGADSSLDFGSDTRQMINLWDESYGVGIQSLTAYFRSYDNFAWFKGGSHSNTTYDPGPDGTALMVLDGSGNLGIGTTSPGDKLDVNGSIGALTLDLTGATGLEMRRPGREAWGLYQTSSGPGIGFYNIDDGQYRLFLTETGNVGVGTYGPNSKLDIVAHGDGASLLRLSTERPWEFRQFSSGSDAGLELAGTGSGKRFRIINSMGTRALELRAHDDPAQSYAYLVPDGGGVGIGTPSSHGYKLAVNGSAAKTDSVYWTILSDIRLKQNVRPLSGALDRLLGLRGVTFEWKDPEEHNNLAGPQIGLIAQEVEEVFPDWVHPRDDGYKTLNPRGFTALTVEALRELRAEKDAALAAQREQIADQREQIASLEARLSELELLIARLAPQEATPGGDAGQLENPR